MTILQSNIALGVKTVPQAFTAGAVVAYRASFTIPTGMTIATTDILELAILPADHEFVDAKIIPEGAFGSGATANVGIMTGDVGEPDTARTVDSKIFSAATLTGVVDLSAVTAFTIAKDDVDRSIGVTFSAAITGAGQVFTLLLILTQ